MCVFVQELITGVVLQYTVTMGTVVLLVRNFKYDTVPMKIGCEIESTFREVQLM